MLKLKGNSRKKIESLARFALIYNYLGQLDSQLTVDQLLEEPQRKTAFSLYLSIAK